MALLVLRHLGLLLNIKQRLIGHACKIFSIQDLLFGIRNAELIEGLEPLLCKDQDPLRCFNLCIGLFRMHCDCHISDKRPWGCRVDEKEFILCFELELHVEARVSDHLIGISNLIPGKAGFTMRAPEDRRKAFIQQAALMELLQGPPSCLNIALIIGEVRLLPCVPAAERIIHIKPDLLILCGKLSAGSCKLGDAHLLNIFF